MLTNLSIRNYALIRELEVSPSKGLNIVTGETGAGKSIILGAVGLLLGKRADTKILFSDKEKCIIEGEFNVEPYGLESLFEALDLDYESSTIIRREINPNGKSRAFVNDIPATLDVLKNVGLRLLDIHSQNESIEIAKKNVKLNIVDDYAQSGLLKQKFQQAFKEFQKADRNFQELISKQAESTKEKDYNNFLLDELVKASLSAGEQETLEAELKVLDNSEDIKRKLSQVVGEFQESDFSLSDRLSDLNNLVQNVSDFSDKIEEQYKRFSSSIAELKDIVEELSGINEAIEYDPKRIEEVNERLAVIYQLQQKHQAIDIENLLKIQSELELKVLETQNLEEDLKESERELKVREKLMIDLAEELSERRRSVLDNFSDDINKLLSYVGMPDGKLEMSYKRINPGGNGIDEVEMLFSANKGVEPQPVSQVASGGEFSRLMLCIKYLLASKTSLPTIIFDEIDTGVSGEIAKKMAVMMKKMSAQHQVIAISHLPQIAAKGDSHYFVYKDNNSDTAESLMRKLDQEDHLEEIAKMIGGDNPSPAALKNAKELIES